MVDGAMIYEISIDWVIDTSYEIDIEYIKESD